MSISFVRLRHYWKAFKRWNWVRACFAFHEAPWWLRVAFAEHHARRAHDSLFASLRYRATTLVKSVRARPAVSNPVNAVAVNDRESGATQWIVNITETFAVRVRTHF